jgi:hypothetical protein
MSAQNASRRSLNQYSFTFSLLLMLLFAVTRAQAQTTDAQEASALVAAPNENVVFQWNRVLTEALRVPGLHPNAAVGPIRSYAMMHAAMFDAANSIEKSYTAYLVTAYSHRHASVEAAVVQAARLDEC